MFLDQAKRKALLDLFISPFTLVPGVIGITALMGAWANDGPATLAFGGVVALIVAAGVTTTRFLLSFEKMMQKAWNTLQEQEKTKKKQELLDLYDKLLGDGDDRTSKALMDLIDIYSHFNDNVKSAHIAVGARGLLTDKVDKLFRDCVNALKETYALHQQADDLHGAARKSVLDSRDRKVKEVVASVKSMSKVIDQLLQLSEQAQGQSGNSLSRQAAELDQMLEVAKRTNERMAQMGLQGQDAEM